MNESASSLIPPLQELFMKGINFFPNESSSDFRLDLSRRRFYQALRRRFLPDASGYYPGSGADPVPVSVFGSAVIYGSLRDFDYFGALKKNISGVPGAYERYVKSFGPFVNLSGIYADALNTPIADEKVDFVIIYGIPLDNQTALVNESARVLKKGGIIILEEDVRVNEINELMIRHPDRYAQRLRTFSELGFNKYEEGKYNTVTGVFYTRQGTYAEYLAALHGQPSEFPADMPTDAVLNFEVPLEEYVQGFYIGEHVSINAHEIMLLEKPK